MLLYLIKKSQPGIASSICELLKVLDGVYSATFKEMIYVDNFVLDTENYGLKFAPNFDKNANWDFICYINSDYAGDPNSCQSVSGYILYVQSVPISWGSKAHKSITLSSSETEFFMHSEMVKEIVFIARLLESMEIKVHFTITV